MKYISPYDIVCTQTFSQLDFYKKFMCGAQHWRVTTRALDSFMTLLVGEDDEKFQGKKSA
jgi:hypothetical protein